MANRDGEICIQMVLLGERVESVTIENRRNLSASQLLAGKTVQQALLLVPLIFSICGAAQSHAACSAAEQALDIIPDPSVQQRRLMMVQAENVRELLWRVLLDWPQFVNEPADKTVMQRVLVLTKRFQSLLGGTARLFHPGVEMEPISSDAFKVLDAVRNEITELVEAQVLGMKWDAWIKLASLAELAQWAAATNTSSARLVCRCINNGWQTLGQTDIAQLRPSDVDRLYPWLDAPEFIAAPTFQNQPRETTADLRSDSTLLQACFQNYGNGLLTRLLGRIDSIAQLAGPLGATPVPTLNQGTLAEAEAGLGVVQTARGLLVHRIQLAAERIKDYRILAPTEWNFHPDGVVAKSLLRLQGAPALIETQTRILINTVDPCVGYRLRVDQGNAVHARNIIV